MMDRARSRNEEEEESLAPIEGRRRKQKLEGAMAEEARFVRDRRSWREEALRRRYVGSLSCAIFMPSVTLFLFVGPFIFTSWSQDVRITWWVVSFLCLLCSIHYILSHYREFGFHPEIVFVPPSKSGADPARIHTEIARPTRSGGDPCLNGL